MNIGNHITSATQLPAATRYPSSDGGCRAISPATHYSLFIVHYSLFTRFAPCAITCLDFSPCKCADNETTRNLTYHPTAPVGSRFTVHSSLAAPAFFSAKERDTETGLSYFGARYYSSDLSIWLSVDPMSGKYPSLSPYVYCADNPVKLVNPNGEEVHPKGEEEYKMILNTLPKEDREYVKLNSNGFIDKDLMSSHGSNSGNYEALLALASDEMVYDVQLETTFTFADQNGTLFSITATYQGKNPESTLGLEGVTETGLSTGEEGIQGWAPTPGNNYNYNSPDSHVKIYVNSQFSDAGRAETFSHEAYGHSYLYLLSGHDSSKSGHMPPPPDGIGDGNTVLETMIVRAKRETYINMNR